MNYVSLLIKPASGHCNMRCRYCFYSRLTEGREEGNLAIMDQDTARVLIDRAFEAVNPRGDIVFTFQGGEPTLAGLDFYRQFVKMVNVHRKKKPNVKIHYCLQTNGLNMDDEWIDFLKENSFLAGVSLDGSKAIHDYLRPDAAGKGTYGRVVQNIQKMLENDVRVNLLCVISEQCAKHPLQVYQSLKKTGARYFQFIPYIDGDDNAADAAKAQASPFTLKEETYGKFLITLFSLWKKDYENSKDPTHIQYFEDMLLILDRKPPTTCTTTGRCGGSFIIEADGTVYPCDFYSEDQWAFGNIHQESLEVLGKSEKAHAFLEESALIPQECEHCDLFSFCQGGCKRQWLKDEKTGENRHRYCKAHQQFFRHALRDLVLIYHNEHMQKLMNSVR